MFLTVILSACPLNAYSSESGLLRLCFGSMPVAMYNVLHVTNVLFGEIHILENAKYLGMYHL